MVKTTNFCMSIKMDILEHLILKTVLNTSENYAREESYPDNGILITTNWIGSIVYIKQPVGT